MALPEMRIFWDGRWHEGPVNLAGPHTHAFWLASSVFDGARVFEGVIPDLDRHCERLNQSAKRIHLVPTMAPDAVAALVRDGAKRFGPDVQLYVKPMYWAERGTQYSVIVPDPESTVFCLQLFVAPLRETKSLALTLSPYRRPTIETMPTDAKLGALYPNNARALIEAKGRGFDNCLVADMLGNIAETATSNIFLAREGVVRTPAPNGTFLDGITRRRVIALLREAGQEVVEQSLTYADFLAADEIFTSGNNNKVQSVTRIDGRDLQPGPISRRARALYWDFAHSGL